MKFTNKLLKAKIIKRYKRFFADVILDGKVVTAHVPNTGPMRGTWEYAEYCYIMKKEKPKKLLYGVELVEDKNQNLIGINTHLPNKIIEEAIKNGILFKDHDKYKREVKIGNSKIDFLIEDDLYLEIKNVSGVDENNIAYFPDTVSERALKHLRELMEIENNGMKSCLIFLIQRNNNNKFRAGIEFHEEYALELEKAIKKGLTVKAFNCYITLEEIKIGEELEIILNS